VNRLTQTAVDCT